MSPFQNAMETIQWSNTMTKAYEQHLGCNSNEQTVDRLLHFKKCVQTQGKAFLRRACPGFLMCAELDKKKQNKNKNMDEGR